LPSSWTERLTSIKQVAEEKPFTVEGKAMGDEKMIAELQTDKETGKISIVYYGTSMKMPVRSLLSSTAHQLAHDAFGGFVSTQQPSGEASLEFRKRLAYKVMTELRSDKTHMNDQMREMMQNGAPNEALASEYLADRMKDEIVTRALFDPRRK